MANVLSKSGPAIESARTLNLLDKKSGDVNTLCNVFIWTAWHVDNNIVSLSEWDQKTQEKLCNYSLCIKTKDRKTHKVKKNYIVSTRSRFDFAQKFATC